MQQITNIRKLTGFLLLACIVQACHSATVAPASAPKPLMCYVCENCAKITKQTPLEACDAEFFDKNSTTQDLTTTTTAAAETSTNTAESTTTTIITTTTIATPTTTTVGNTEVPTTEGTTTEAIPTAPTVGPPVTVPTPPNVGTVADLLVVPEVTISSNDTESTSTVSYEAPKAMQLVGDNYTYHCYSVQKKVNGTAQVERGCSRVTTTESVCNELKVLNNGTELSKCVPCTNSRCNGSSALGVSMAALLFTLIAAVLSRQ
ncbi:probable serine/threonine-protein kinase DDB_G0275165 [Zeugodacus cucurbitae]|uniref:Uncharacterized protein n=1 Tax=Zeugodacus cucurbitae TaxID=28588 RepID=A0A0A1X001_ZEUCU|nr:probable serine/threonine-protein kinase DDB_G0275165 [Zeugodacus cucurbitae]